MKATSLPTLCVTTAVNQAYQEFIPWYVYTCNACYPAYRPIILLAGRMQEHVAQAMDVIPGRNYVVREDAFPGCRTDDPNVIKCLRWLTYDDLWTPFDCVYIGDVDILVCPDRLPLLEGHLDHCRRMQLPFSNVVRNNQQRLTGLHFVKRHEWFHAVRPIMHKYRAMLANGEPFARDPRSGRPHANEHLLYLIVGEAGFEYPEEEGGTYRPLHGLHLGVWDDPVLPRLYANKRKMRGLTTGSHAQYWAYFRTLLQESVCSQLMRLLPKPRRMIENLSQFYGKQLME